jgi:hypothetical protein
MTGSRGAVNGARPGWIWGGGGCMSRGTKVKEPRMEDVQPTNVICNGKMNNNLHMVHFYTSNYYVIGPNSLFHLL